MDNPRRVRRGSGAACAARLRDCGTRGPVSRYARPPTRRSNARRFERNKKVAATAASKKVETHMNDKPSGLTLNRTTVLLLVLTLAVIWFVPLGT